MKDKKKKKGGQRAGAGRKPSGRQKEAVTVYTDVSKFGGKDGTRVAIYEFLDGVISKTGESKFLPLSDEEVKQSSWPLPKDYVKAKKIGAVKSDDTVVNDVTKPTSVLKPQEQPKTNFSIDTKPKTLDELKKLCPAELEGLDRSKWISTERQKYGI